MRHPDGSSSRQRSERRTPKNLKTGIGVGLIAIPAIGLALAGSTVSWQLAILHVLLAISLALATRLSDDALSEAGRARQLLVALIPLVGVIAIGLLPLPISVLRFVAPGVAAAWPDASWHSLSTNAGDTVTELSIWSLLFGYAALVGVWGSRGRKAVKAETALFIGVSAFMAFALAHIMSGSTAILGLLEVHDPQSPFFAPFVNRNFFGTVLLLALPLAIGEAAGAWRTDALAAAPFVILSTVLLAFMLSLHSFSTLAALAIEGALLLWMVQGLPRGTRTMLGLGGVVALVTAFAIFWNTEPDWWMVSGVPRITQWSDAPAIFADHWLAGVGGGAHATAYPPYRSVLSFLQFSHAHNDPLQWLLETGLLGIVAFAAFVYLLPATERGQRRSYWTIGLIGAAASALWNFPFQVPGIALVFIGLLAVRLTCFDGSMRSNPRQIRMVLGALALVQLPMLGWQVRSHVADAAVAVVESSNTSPADRSAAVRTLTWVSPRAPAIALDAAWTAQRGGQTAAAITAALAVEAAHPNDARALRRAALVLWRSQRHDDALRLLERAANRDPNDFRTWVAISRIHRERADGGKALDAFAEALRHWPAEQAGNGWPLDEAWSLLPMGEYWVEALADAPAWWSWRLARRMLDANEPELALAAMQQAALLNPLIYTDAALWVQVLLANDRVADAEGLAKRLCNEQPELVWHWEALGDALEYQERYEEAVATYLEGFRMHRTRTTLAMRAVRAATKGGGPERGLQIVRQVDVQARNDPRLDFEAARLHLATGDRAECVLRLEDGTFNDNPLRARAKALWRRCGGSGELH